MSNTETVFSNQEIFGFDNSRQDVFGVIVSMAFVFALLATLLSAINYGFLNMLGSENSKWYVANFYYVCGLPLTFCACSIILMLVSNLISIGGIYDWTVWYIMFFIGIGFLLCFWFFYHKARKRVLRHLRAQVYHRQQSQRQHSVRGNLSTGTSPRTTTTGGNTGRGGNLDLSSGLMNGNHDDKIQMAIDMRLQKHIQREKNRVSQYGKGFHIPKNGTSTGLGSSNSSENVGTSLKQNVQSNSAQNSPPNEQNGISYDD